MPPADARLGLYGAGAFGRYVLHALADSPHPVVAIASRTSEHAESTAQRYGIRRVHASYDVLLADGSVDAVIVATVPSDHGPATRKALAAGKHVFVEKPLATSAADGFDV